MILPVCICYQFQCPRSAQWSMRAMYFCPDPSANYSCVENVLEKKFTEGCSLLDFERPGRRITFSGGKSAHDCSSDRYQPPVIKYWTNISTDCIYYRSLCNEIGQVKLKITQLYEDTACRCDYTRGYDYVVRPKDICSCEPAKEDCSCYQRKCQNKSHILSPDYRCTDGIEDGKNYQCHTISKINAGSSGKNQTAYENNLGINTFSEPTKWNKTAAGLCFAVLVAAFIICTFYYCTRRYNKCYEMKAINESTNKDVELNIVDDRENVETNIDEYDETNMTNEKTIIDSNHQKQGIQAVVHTNEDRREDINILFKEWEKLDEKFAETRASKDLMEYIASKKVHLAIITGRQGSGKSITSQHVLLSMKKKGYEIVPVTSVSEMSLDTDNKQIFYLDDLFGKFHALRNEIEYLEQNAKTIKKVLSNSKCIVTCKLQIFEEYQVDCLLKNINLSKYEVINLSGKHKLSIEEKTNISRQYLNESELKRIKIDVVEKMISFPLLCRLYENYKQVNLFLTPEIYMSQNLNKIMQDQDNMEYFCIVLCVLLNDKISFKLLTNNASTELKELRDIISVRLDLQVQQMTLLETFDSLVGVYFNKTLFGYRSIHDILFDIFCSNVSENMMDIFIKFADSTLLSERAILHSLNQTDNPSDKIIVPTDFEEMFFQRMIADYKKGKISCVFESYQMKFKSYRSKIMSLFIDEVENLDRTDEDGRTAIYICSQYGYFDILEGFCNAGGNVNLCTNEGLTPLYASINASRASETENHTKCVELLLKDVRS